MRRIFDDDKVENGQFRSNPPDATHFASGRRFGTLEVGPHYGAFQYTTSNEMGHADTTILNLNRP